MIRREKYLQQLIANRDNGFPKIITGIRRCGKSFLMKEIFREYLLSDGMKEDDILILELDDDSLYFLTAKGKGFHDRLKERKFLAFTAMKGEDTMSSVAVSIRGKVRELGSERLSMLFEKNPYMDRIYPTEESRTALTVFQIYEGTGEWFDLSKRPIERASFTFGGAEEIKEGYFVTDKCIGCKLCYSRCPQKCIDISVKPVVIHQNNCLHCGNCYEICPAGAIGKRGCS